MYKCKHFKIQELVDKETYELLGERAWNIFDDGVKMDLDLLRELVNAPLTCNNWFNGGNYSQRGFRSQKSTIGSKNSRHRHASAFDLSSSTHTSEELRQIAINNASAFECFNRLEGKVSWCHIDYHQDYPSYTFYIFYP